MSTAAAMPSTTVASRLGSSPLRLIMKGLATTAKPATTTAAWIKN